MALLATPVRVRNLLNSTVLFENKMQLMMEDNQSTPAATNMYLIGIYFLSCVVGFDEGVVLSGSALCKYVVL